MPRIIALDTIAAEGLELLKKTPGVEYDVKTGLSGEELRSTLAQYDGAIARLRPNDLRRHVHRRGEVLPRTSHGPR